MVSEECTYLADKIKRILSDLQWEYRNNILKPALGRMKEVFRGDWGWSQSGRAVAFKDTDGIVILVMSDDFSVNFSVTPEPSADVAKLAEKAEMLRARLSGFIDEYLSACLTRS